MRELPVAGGIAVAGGAAFALLLAVGACLPALQHGGAPEPRQQLAVPAGATLPGLQRDPYGLEQLAPYRAPLASTGSLAMGRQPRREYSAAPTSPAWLPARATPSPAASSTPTPRATPSPTSTPTPRATPLGVPDPTPTRAPLLRQIIAPLHALLPL